MSKVSAGVTTVYVYDAQGQMAAEYSTAATTPPCTTCYLTWDHLGSTRMVTAQDGTVVARHDYLPFGEEILSGYAGRTNLWGGTDNVNQKFTGKERDAESGLDYFGARYFGSALSRFTSPDPRNAGAGREEDPQSWNLYAYSRNNPLVYTDPTGESYRICDASGKNCAKDQLSDDEFDSEKRAGQSNGERFSNGSIYHYDSDGNRVTDGTYRQTDVDLSPGASSVVRNLGQNADAQQRFIGKFAVYSALTGVGVAGGLQAVEGGLTTLDSEASYFRYSGGQLNRLIGDAQRQLLKDFFGQNVQGALSRLENLDIPSGLTRRTLEVYKETAIRVVQRGPGAPGFQVQSLRLQLVEKALSNIK